MSGFAISAILRTLAPLQYITRGDTRVPIAILDGPIDVTHPSLRESRLDGFGSWRADKDSQASRHGTAVASLLWGQPGTSVEGLVPACSGYAIPIFSDGEDGNLALCSQLDVARAILHALNHGARIINISGGESTTSGEPYPLLNDALRACEEAGVLVIAAAGNDGCCCLHLPAASPLVLAVGAMDAGGLPSVSSNWGDAYRANGIVAPGERLRAAAPGGGVVVVSGTSFATAIVTGAAALLMSLQLQRGEQPDARAVRRALLDGAVPCGADLIAPQRCLAGRLDLEKAILALTAGRLPLESEGAQAPALVGNTIEPSTLLITKMEGRMNESSSTKKTDAAEATVMPQATLEGGVIPLGGESECSCKNATASASPTATAVGSTAPKPPPLVYALGTIGYEFRREARRDSFAQTMSAKSRNPTIANDMLAHLAEHPYDAGGLIWTLSLNTTPIYAIAPAGPFATVGYELLRTFLKEHLQEGVERVSIPGVAAGEVTLLSGQTVPVLVPEPRGMCSWNTRALSDAVCGPKEAPGYCDKVDGLVNFLERVYHELSNLGIRPQERALNYAATNALQVAKVFEDAVRRNLELDDISVTPSPICRPGSECWDAKLTFFSPTRRLEQARRAYRFTVDVSDIVPVTVGEPKSWNVY